MTNLERIVEVWHEKIYCKDCPMKIPGDCCYHCKEVIEKSLTDTEWLNQEETVYD